MSPASCRRQAGLTLVELIVSMLLGLLVVSGVFVTYIGTGVSDRQQRALGRMTEDAQLAMALITRELQMAGYGQIQSVGAAGAQGLRPVQFVQTHRPLFGCDNGFIDNKAAVASADCNPVAAGVPATGTPAIEITHQVTADTTAPDGSGKPTDCQGAAVAAPGVVSNRFFVVQGGTAAEPDFELHCASQVSGSQPLVPQVQKVHFRYGIAPNWNSDDPVTWRPQRFVMATDMAANDWDRVVAVRVCLLMRSADPVLADATPQATAAPASAPATAPAPAPAASSAASAASTPFVAGPATYVDCDGQRQNAGDRHLRRAFKSTVTLRNRVS